MIDPKNGETKRNRNQNRNPDQLSQFTRYVSFESDSLDSIILYFVRFHFVRIHSLAFIFDSMSNPLHLKHCNKKKRQEIGSFAISCCLFVFFLFSRYFSRLNLFNISFELSLNTESHTQKKQMELLCRMFQKQKTKRVCH